MVKLCCILCVLRSIQHDVNWSMRLCKVMSISRLCYQVHMKNCASPYAKEGVCWYYQVVIDIHNCCRGQEQLLLCSLFYLAAFIWSLYGEKPLIRHGELLLNIHKWKSTSDCNGLFCSNIKMKGLIYFSLQQDADVLKRICGHSRPRDYTFSLVWTLNVSVATVIIYVLC